MEIVKNDVIGFVNSLTYDNLGRKNSQNNTHPKNEGSKKGELPSHVQFDQVRGKAMTLDDEIKEYQNLITYYQMQLKFLEEAGDHSGWRNQLLKFLKEKTTFKPNDSLLSASESVTLDTYMGELQEKVQTVRNKLSKWQVELQNIFASGLLNEVEINQNFSNFKHDGEAQAIFKSLKGSTVRSLLI